LNRSGDSSVRLTYAAASSSRKGSSRSKIRMTCGDGPFAATSGWNAFKPAAMALRLVFPDELVTRAN
jgi:hypothetical protein